MVQIIMKNFNKIILASTALAAVLTLDVSAKTASDDSGKVYVKASAGISLTQKVSKEYFLDAKKPKNSPIFALGAGYKFNDNFRADLNIGMINNIKIKGKDSLANQKNKSMFVLANAYYDIGEYNGFTPYGTLGIGLAQNKSGNLLVGNNPAIVTKKKSTSFAWNVGAGVQYSITPEIKADLGYRFMDLGKIKRGFNTGSKKTISSKLRTNAIVVGVNYSF
jgi:opacity protein-like surface antigen